MRTRGVLVAAGLMLGACSAGDDTRPATTTTTGAATTTGASTATAAGIASSTTAAPDEVGADLDRWLAMLDGTHPDAFHAVGREQFVGALDELRADVPDLSPAAATVGVMRVAGLLSRERDGHQFALPKPGHEWPVLPLQIYEFPEGVIVTAALSPNDALTGARIDAIGGTPIADVLAMVEPLVPRDGPATVPTFRPGFVLRTIVLRGLGIVPDVDGPIELTVSDAAGTRTVEVAPIPLDEHVEWAGEFGFLRLPARAQPAYLDRLDVTDRAELLPDGTLLLRLTEIRGAAAMLEQLGDAAVLDRSARVVLDLRQNPGGDNGNNRAVVERLEALSAERPDMPLFVLTDRVTFSAASNLATDLEQRTDAVFVGEAMGGGLNFWDDVRDIDLPHLPVPMRIGVSTTYWQRAAADDPRLTIAPDVEVEVTAADLFAGRDPTMEAAIAAS